MRPLLFALALAALSCEYAPPGQCKADADCSVGTVCQTGVCVSCPGGVCGASSVLGTAGGTISFYPQPYSTGSSITLSVSANAIPDNTTVSVAGRDCSGLPPSPTGGTCVLAFDLAASGVTQFARPIRLNGANITQQKSGSILIVARIEGNSWSDIGMAVVGGNGTFRSLHPTTTLPGVTKPGTYVLFIAAPGSPEALFVADFGLALIPNDSVGTSGLQIVALYDDDGNPLQQPTLSLMPIGGGDLDGAAITPDGSQGVMVDGGNFVVFFSGIGSGTPVASSFNIDVSAYGGDGDSIAITPDGNEAIVSADGSSLVVITGIAIGRAQPSQTIPLSGLADGLVMSNDGKVLLARGSGGIDVYAVTPRTPVAGPLGGTSYHDYTSITTITSQIGGPAGEDGRDGMAVSPFDGSRAVVVGGFGTPRIYLITGLPGSASSLPVVHAGVPISGASTAWAVSVTADGTRAIVGTDAGLVMFTGVDTGNLVQAGAPFNPTFSAAGAVYSLSQAGVPTLGISLDGQHVVALTASPTDSNGTLLMFPILSNGFGPAVSMLTGVAVPSNDQLMLH